MNKVILIGNLGDTVTLNFTSKGMAVANMRLATNHKYTDASGKKNSSTEWHRVVVWGKQGEACAEYLEKGSKVMVEGRLQTKKYTDKKDNIVRYYVEVVAERVQFLDSKPAGADDSTGMEIPNDEHQMIDDLPL